jgi:GT2 family glycosyltransferase
MTTRHDALSLMMRSLDPRVMNVSVLTPSYEYGGFIADGIESIIQQQGVRLQHIIQDAGSGDETLQVLRSFQNVKSEANLEEGQLLEIACES